MRREAMGFDKVFAGEPRQMPLRAHGAFPGAQRLRLLTPHPPHLGLEHFRRNGRDDAARDLVLNSKDVRELAVVSAGPDMSATLRLDELSCDADAFARPAHAAFKDIAHPELAADPTHIDRLSLVGVARVAGDDENAVVLREARDDVLGDSVREVFLVGRPTYC